jgi:hypothetical protein
MATRHTNHWTDQIDDVTASFNNAFGQLTQEQLNQKPDPTAWSIAQNIDHLIVINSTYYPIIKQVKENRYQLPWLGKIGFLVSFLGKAILRSVQPDRKTRTKTFPIWEPAKSDIGSDILVRFAEHQERLKQMIISCADLLQTGTIISSPANKNIVYKLETAFDIIVAHERRHFEQAKEVYGRIRSQVSK